LREHCLRRCQAPILHEEQAGLPGCLGTGTIPRPSEENREAREETESHRPWPLLLLLPLQLQLLQLLPPRRRLLLYLCLLAEQKVAAEEILLGVQRLQAEEEAEERQGQIPKRQPNLA
jgi:hypothetical protein